MFKQGISSTTAGRGALSAAYSNLEALICSGMPVVYGWLIVVFSNPRTPAWLRWGPGGHFFVAAALRLVSYWLMRSIDTTLLHIDDADDRPSQVIASEDSSPAKVSRRVDANGFHLPVPVAGSAFPR